LVEQAKRKNRLQWVLWTLFVILLLVVGLGPMLLLVSYTRDFNFLNRFSTENGQQVEQPPEELYLDSYAVQYIYRYCDHSRVFEPGEIPVDYPRPSAVLTTIVESLHKADTNIEDLLDYIKHTDGWHLAGTRLNGSRLFFTLTYLDDHCPECAKKFYLGIAGNDYIAVFQGEAPGGKLVEITEYKVKEIHREELRKGVTFETEAQKDSLLQYFTS
jgi:hypothetical protein